MILKVSPVKKEGGQILSRLSVPLHPVFLCFFLVSIACRKPAHRAFLRQQRLFR